MLDTLRGYGVSEHTQFNINDRVYDALEFVYVTICAVFVEGINQFEFCADELEDNNSCSLNSTREFDE